MKNKFYLTLLFMFLFSLYSEAQLSITSSGDWLEVIDSSDLISGAGSDLKSSYESAQNATVLSISGSQDPLDAWHVNIRRIDSTWHNNFILYARRTSDGTGNGSISDGTSYIIVDTTDSFFFSGSGDRSGINIQYKLEGMSIQIPPNNYSTNIVFTVVDD